MRNYHFLSGNNKYTARFYHDEFSPRVEKLYDRFAEKLFVFFSDGSFEVVLAGFQRIQRLSIKKKERKKKGKKKVL